MTLIYVLKNKLDLDSNVNISGAAQTVTDFWNGLGVLFTCALSFWSVYINEIVTDFTPIFECYEETTIKCQRLWIQKFQTKKR